MLSVRRCATSRHTHNRILLPVDLSCSSAGKRHRSRFCVATICAGTPPSFSSHQLPRIVDSIPRKGPAAGFPHFPEVNLREPIKWVQKEAASDRYSWPVLILAAVALAVIAETALIAKDKLTGQTRQSRSERREVQEASRQADDGQRADALAQQLAEAPESERQLLIAEQQYKKQLLQTDRLDERNRGLLWLAVTTVAMLWIAGAFEIDATHPFIF